MPLGCDCFPGCWGKHSEGWPQIEFKTKEAHDNARRWIIQTKALPIGSYVSVSDTVLKLETQAHVDKVLLGMACDETAYSERHALDEILAELKRARDKFPLWPTDAQDAVAIIHEEVGELQKDILQMKYEPSKGKTIEHVRAEAMQTAAMALRFYFNIDRYTFIPGPQHEG
jgi:predicted nucleic acid-binding protein